MSKMIYKQILRATNLPKTVNIEQNSMDYILNTGKHASPYSVGKDVWYNHFIGFFTDKSNPGYGFGYKDIVSQEYHYPIFADKVDYQIECETDWVEKPYLVMFYGSDNQSQFVRFATLKETIKFINTNYKSIDEIDNMQFYNS